MARQRREVNERMRLVCPAEGTEQREDSFQRVNVEIRFYPKTDPRLKLEHPLLTEGS